MVPRRIVLLTAVLSGFAAPVLALPIVVGSFNIAGTFTDTENTMTWNSAISPFTADQANIGPRD